MKQFIRIINDKPLGIIETNGYETLQTNDLIEIEDRKLFEEIQRDHTKFEIKNGKVQKKEDNKPPLAK